MNPAIFRFPHPVSPSHTHAHEKQAHPQKEKRSRTVYTVWEEDAQLTLKTNSTELQHRMLVTFYERENIMFPSLQFEEV